MVKVYIEKTNDERKNRPKGPKRFSSKRLKLDSISSQSNSSFKHKLKQDQKTNSNGLDGFNLIQIAFDSKRDSLLS